MRLFIIAVLLIVLCIDPPEFVSSRKLFFLVGSIVSNSPPDGMYRVGIIANGTDEKFTNTDASMLWDETLTWEGITEANSNEAYLKLYKCNYGHDHLECYEKTRAAKIIDLAGCKKTTEDYTDIHYTFEDGDDALEDFNVFCKAVVVYTLTDCSSRLPLNSTGSCSSSLEVPPTCISDLGTGKCTDSSLTPCALRNATESGNWPCGDVSELAKCYLDVGGTDPTKCVLSCTGKDFAGDIVTGKCRVSEESGDCTQRTPTSSGNWPCGSSSETPKCYQDVGGANENKCVVECSSNKHTPNGTTGKCQTAPPDPGSSKKKVPWWVFLIIGVVVLVVIAAVIVTIVVVVKMKKKKTEKKVNPSGGQLDVRNKYKNDDPGRSTKRKSKRSKRSSRSSSRHSSSSSSSPSGRKKSRRSKH